MAPGFKTRGRGIRLGGGVSDGDDIEQVMLRVWKYVYSVDFDKTG